MLVEGGCVYHALPEPVDCDDNPVILELVAVQDTECGGSEGMIEVLASGGEGPYVFRLGNAGLQAETQFRGLSAGVYEITASDANNCMATMEVTVKNLEGMNLKVETTIAGCFDTQGKITVTPEGGEQPYMFRLGNGAFQDENVFGNLSHGQYTVTARDASGCEVTQITRVRSGISFSQSIKPIIEENCAISGCHNGSQFPDFRVFRNIQDNASRIKDQVVTRTMPQDGELSQDEIDLIVCWVDDGAPNN